MSTSTPSPRPPRPVMRGTPVAAPSRSSQSPSNFASPGGVARAALSSSRAGAPPAPRRSSLRASPSRPSSRGGAGSPDHPSSRDSISASLAREIEEKEALLVKLQEQEIVITTLNNENAAFLSAVAAAETRLGELYAEQTRMEDEMVARHEVADKLRTQIRDLEKEKRDLQRRYNEQTQTFDAERQAFYDNEQHLKSRIQNLTQARKSYYGRRSSTSEISEAQAHEEEEGEIGSSSRMELGGDQETPETTALKLELSTLSTSHASLQSTLQLLQMQLSELQRVNKELQEENESYNILLVERTINGQYEILRRTAPTPSTWQGDEDDGSSLHGTTGSRSNLDVLPEVGEDQHPVLTELDLALAQPRVPSPDLHRSGRKGPRRNGSTRTSSPGRGETLGDLPITGPGLDLAAELGRAENKDILDGYTADGPPEPVPSLHVDYKIVEALRSEVKSLKDANKALNLYASKILDRIISQDGFESVLAVDYKPRTAEAKSPTAHTAPAKTSHARSFLPRVLSDSTSPANPIASAVSPLKDTSAAKRQKRGLSLDWGRLWSSSSSSSSPGPPALLPVSGNTAGATSTGTASVLSTTIASTVGTARKLDLPEDDEDRILREYLHAEMRLHGIEKGTPPSIETAISPHALPIPLTVTPSTPTSSLKARLPFFSRDSASDEAFHTNPQSLTSETLQQAEAESTLAALDAREKMLAEEIGKGRPGGFTELGPRPGSSLSERHRRRRSEESSHSVKSGASTLWSAGRISLEGNRNLGHAEDEDEAR
ncbi:hypothetical protein BS47DRAFT_1485651 [Hydnum rufescens UP504]|uniref:Uncharacterized protein n=1 Tax=Hydnum rufescens UP504 TaxID=1448309 RepID=A0A9P6DW71_9AGAM|nr:hypothetical protein BS47DRAFT_1485651 [Hydnum rufescens UP504]